MIQPKHSFSKKNFEIKKIFIDREEAKALYKKDLMITRKITMY